MFKDFENIFQKYYPMERKIDSLFNIISIRMNALIPTASVILPSDLIPISVNLCNHGDFEQNPSKNKILKKRAFFAFFRLRRFTNYSFSFVSVPRIFRNQQEVENRHLKFFRCKNNNLFTCGIKNFLPVGLPSKRKVMTFNLNLFYIHSGKM